MPVIEHGSQKTVDRTKTKNCVRTGTELYEEDAVAVIARRDFLKYSAIGSLILLTCSPPARRIATASPVGSSNNYYLAHRQALTEEFRQVLNDAALFLQPELGPKSTQALLRHALVNFDRLLPEFPFIGGESNWVTKFIPMAGWYAALYPPMKENGKNSEDLGRLMYELSKTGLEKIPKENALSAGKDAFTQEYMDKFKSWAEWTRKREYPANWVADFVQGDGEEFDYGYDYTECGVVKYFQAQGVPELAPYFCLTDFPKNAVLGTGLVRKRTIAQGDGICDFRYKKGRPVIQDWTTEIARIRSGRSR